MKDIENIINRSFFEMNLSYKKIILHNNKNDLQC